VSQIPNDRLRLKEIPPAAAGWDRIIAFADTFNVYEVPGHEQWASVLDAPEQATLNQLRTCLWMAYRSLHWDNGGDLEARLLPGVRRLLALIRARVASGRIG
jgi:hypothetical protein